MMLGLALLLNGCGPGNGLPADLISHLADRGIKITPLSVQAPLSSRGGYIVAQCAPQTVASIISTFKLKRIQPDDPRWSRTIEKAGKAGAVKEMWGVSGRPADFKLKSGGQFEYFYVLITEDGLMYLVAEYAYG